MGRESLAAMSHRDGIRSNMDYQRPTRAAAGNGSTQPDFGVYYDPTQPADHTVTPSRLDALANLAAGTAKNRGREAGGEEEVLYFEQKGGTQPLPLATGTLNLDWVEHRGARYYQANTLVKFLGCAKASKMVGKLDNGETIRVRWQQRKGLKLRLTNVKKAQVIIFISSWALYKFVYVEEKGGKHKSEERAAARSALRDVLGHPEAFFPLKFDDTGVAIAPIQVCESLPFHPGVEFHHVRHRWTAAPSKSSSGEAELTQRQ